MCIRDSSYTFSIVPQALGKEEGERRTKLVSLLDAYFAATGHHINVNVLERETQMCIRDRNMGAPSPMGIIPHS